MAGYQDFKSHMEGRAGMFDNCKKVTIGKDFAVFQFDDAVDLNQSLKFAHTCNKSYSYVLETNSIDKLVCFKEEGDK